MSTMVPRPYDPNYDPVLEQRRALGRSGQGGLTISDLSQVPVFGGVIGGTLGPGGLLNPAPAGHQDMPPVPNASPTAASVSSPPQGGPSYDNSFSAEGFSWAPQTFAGAAERQEKGLNPAQQLGAAENSVPNEVYTAPGGMITSFPGRGANGTKGLSGAEWLKSVQDNPYHSSHGDLVGGDYLGSQDPQPNDSYMNQSGELESGHDGTLFGGAGGGNGTGADYEGRLRMATLKSAIEGAQDPFREQRIKGDYAVQAQVAPALIGARASQNVADTRAQADRDVANLQGQNAITKEEAQYQSYDALIAQQTQQKLAKMMQDAQASGASPQQVEQARQKILNEAIQSMLKIREFGVGGRPNPLESLYAGLSTGTQPTQVPQPNPQQ